MEMDANQFKVFKAALEKSGALKRPCIECGGLVFDSGCLFKMHEWNPDKKAFTGRLLVVAPVSCYKCGHVRFFNVKVVQDNHIECVARGNDI